MRMTERAVHFSCEGQRLLGVLSLPDSPSRTGVVIVVGGPQYRAGSHRQFVQLARHLAEGGHTVLRFDVRGMGDSTGDLRSFEHLSPDVAAAVDTLCHESSGVQRVVLWGLCDGASAALLYLHDRPDPRVAGLVLANPWVRTEVSQARTTVRHYYRQRLKEWGFWSRVLSPAVAWRAAMGLVQNLRLATAAPASSPNTLAFSQRMALGWQHFKGPVLLQLSEADLVAREFESALREQAHWQAAVAANAPHTVSLTGSDHTCSQPQAQRELQRTTLAWLREQALA